MNKVLKCFILIIALFLISSCVRKTIYQKELFDSRTIKKNDYSIFVTLQGKYAKYELDSKDDLVKLSGPYDLVISIDSPKRKIMSARIDSLQVISQKDKKTIFKLDKVLKQDLKTTKWISLDANKPTESNNAFTSFRIKEIVIKYNTYLVVFKITLYDASNSEIVEDLKMIIKANPKFYKRISLIENLMSV